MSNFVSQNSTKNDYNSIRSETEVATKNRRKCISTKSGSKAAKKYHMSWQKAETDRITFDTTGMFNNPYREGGIYNAFTQSLCNLGVNKKHSFRLVKDKIKNILLEHISHNKINAWDNFLNKQSSNIFMAMDENGRIIETARMLQRIKGYHVYGEKLRQMKMSVNIYMDEYFIPMYELYTKWKSYDEVEPINEYKNRPRKKRI